MTSSIRDRATFVATFDEFEYVLTDEDLLWLGVASLGETHGTKDPNEWAAMMWTWVNRFMLHENRPRTWSSVAQLVKHHSQPVNPKWRRSGSRCVDRIGAANCRESQLRWRDKMASFLSSRQIPPAVLPTLREFAAGRISQPPGGPWVDFAVTAPAKNHGTRLYGGNWYLNPLQLSKTKLLANFMPGEVRVVGASGDDDLLPVAVGLIALGTGLLVKWFTSRNRP